MANDAQMPERIWATPEEAELLQPEDGFNPADQGMTEYVRSDLCASDGRNKPCAGKVRVQLRENRINGGGDE